MALARHVNKFLKQFAGMAYSEHKMDKGLVYVPYQITKSDITDLRPCRWIFHSRNIKNTCKLTFSNSLEKHLYNVL